MGQSYSSHQPVRQTTQWERVQNEPVQIPPTTVETEKPIRSGRGLISPGIGDDKRVQVLTVGEREASQLIVTPDIEPTWEQREPILGGALTRFFDSVFDVTAKALVPGLLGAALFPIIGPFGAFAAAASMSAVTHKIQGVLTPLDLHLQDSTIERLIEPFENSPMDESKLRRVIEEKALPDRQANEDLRQLYYQLLPNIQNAAARSTKINIDGDAYGLIAGDNNIVTQTFNFFLQEEKGLSARQANRHSSGAPINRPPIIQTGTTETSIQIDGTVAGAVIGDENQITQTYNEIPM